VVRVALVNRHFSKVAEIYLTVVSRLHHGLGVGTARIKAIETDAVARGVRLLEVKTLGPSDPDSRYALTSQFYEKMEFLPLEKTNVWGDDTACLSLVKPIG
jgi:GNAT superfamily N-acetyltransferase